jgi:hypothetical protein
MTPTVTKDIAIIAIILLSKVAFLEEKPVKFYSIPLRSAIAYYYDLLSVEDVDKLWPP